MRVLAHRGAAALDRPENTLAAVEAALRLGADGVEVDLRVTRDGVAVCCHDPDLSRLVGWPVEVADLSWRQLRLVRLPGGHRVARLADVVDLVRGRGELVVDVKPEPGPRRWLRRPGAAAAKVLGPARFDRSALTVSSFDPLILVALSRRAPLLRRALLTEPEVPAMVAVSVSVAVRSGCAEVHPHAGALLAAPLTAARAHAAGLGVRTWTVNDPLDAAALAAAGVDAVISDACAELLATVRRAQVA